MVDGAYKVAQYGQWDGYPEGAGVGILNFLKAPGMEDFKESLKGTRFLTEEEIAALDEVYWKASHPHLSRDIGYSILSRIKRSPLELINQIGFAGDSLFCEWAYVIDFDKNTFEVFEGFNTTPIIEGRFLSGDPHLESTQGYEPVKLVKEYPLDNLPTEQEFIADLVEEDPDETMPLVDGEIGMSIGQNYDTESK